MKLVLDALWRAAVYCLLPRVMLLSVLPLVLCVSITGLLGYFYWESGVAFTYAVLDRWSIVQPIYRLMDLLHLSSLHGAVAPLVLVIVAVPLVIIMCLLLVSQIMMPSLVSLVRARRFATLKTLDTESLWLGALRSLGWTLLACVALLLSLPLWFIPPLGLVLPPLIWGWLSYRVMTGDVLSNLATPDERRAVFAQHRGPLLMIGIATGYLGAAPGLLWAMGAASLFLAPMLIMVSVWLYTGIFAFSSLWFAHYVLGALAGLRASAIATKVEPSLIHSNPTHQGTAP